MPPPQFGNNNNNNQQFPNNIIKPNYPPGHPLYNSNNNNQQQQQQPSKYFNANGPVKYFYESNPTMSEAEIAEVSGKVLCKDMNGEFCASIAVKIDYCNEDFLVNNKTIKQLCKFGIVFFFLGK
jgi:hypothetical protein